MKFTIAVTPEESPDAVGELLRSVFFDEKMVGSRFGGNLRETGCYTTFDWRKDVEELPPLVVRGEMGGKAPSHALKWTRGKKKFCTGQSLSRLNPKEDSVLYEEVECRWFWDGDGTLVFLFPDGSCLVNEDCKKDHGWEYLEEPPEY